MSFLPFRKGDCTFEEFCDIVPDGVKADLLDGVIYMASPDNTDAGDLNGWLAAIMYGFVEAKDLGKIFISRIAYRIGPKRGPEPDIGFVAKQFLSQRRRGYIDGAPGLAIEIVSPDSVARDYILKRGIYEEAGVLEYWILDPDEQRATFLRLRNGRYEEAAPVRHIYRSEVLPGFQIDVRWLWAAERPRVYEVLQKLLKGTRRIEGTFPTRSKKRKKK